MKTALNKEKGLEPCKCGEKDIVELFDIKNGKYYYWYKCPVCKFESDARKTGKTAQNNWNKKIQTFQLNSYLMKNKNKQSKTENLSAIIKNLYEYSHHFKDENVYVVKLSKNLIKATFLKITPNGKNYDIRFEQRINRVYRPSVKEWVARRDELLAEFNDVPLGQIKEKYDWVMGR